MIERMNPARRPRGDHGFTLVELLVVIVILGILSGVVVFAVRGAGDKGEVNARATDERTLRTAQEAFCASFGRYAKNQEELVNPSLGNPDWGTKGFLSEKSTLTRMEQVGPTDPEPRPCNGTGYRLIPIRTSPTDPDPPACGEIGGWCPTDAPPEFLHQSFGVPIGRNLVRLRSGKVLGLSNHSAMIFDPAKGEKGEWSDGPDFKPPGGSQAGIDLTVRLDDNPATSQVNECASPSLTVDNCGKVLALGLGLFPGTNRLTYDKWSLYDESGGGSWTELKVPHTRRLGRTSWAVQIMGTSCGDDCGKVLIVGAGGGPGPTNFEPPIGELFDPKSNTFEQTGAYENAGSLAPLPDGRVLMVHRALNGFTTSASLFDPTTGLFTAAPPPGINAESQEDELKVLPGGKVLLTGRSIDQTAGAGAVYKYDPLGGPGEWMQVPSCSPKVFSSRKDCRLLVSLPDDTILAKRTLTTEYFRFHLEPTGGRWEPTGSPETGDLGVAVLLASDNCAHAHCNKVLGVGADLIDSNNSVGVAALYTP